MSNKASDIAKNEELVDLYMQDKIEAIYAQKHGKELIDDFGIDNFDKFNIQDNQTLKSNYEINSQAIANDSNYKVMSDNKKSDLDQLREDGQSGIVAQYHSETLNNNINNSELQKTVPLDITNHKLEQQSRESNNFNKNDADK